MCDAYQPGSTKAALESEGAVIETAAHAEPMAAFVESDERQQHHIESPGVESMIERTRGLGNSETIGTHPIADLHATKPQSTFVVTRCKDG